MIIGVTGKYASGKDAVAEYLQGKGFLHFSLSDEIREEARRRKVKITRENLITLGNSLREKFGPGILAERVANKMAAEQKVVVTSIRNPSEVEVLKKNSEFILVAVTAEAQRRFQWLQQRAREEDPKTFQEFVEKEKLEQSSDPTKQQLHTVEKMAKITVKNDGSLEDLHKKVDLLLENLKKKFRKPRPSWDEYFLSIGREVGKRATCDRGKAGCVIVKDKRILCSGYVGSPAGLPHCDDVGHQLKTTIHEDGQSSQHCVRTVHAEQNAICQAAKFGQSLAGATLYCNMEPCIVCARMLVNSGIVKVFCEKQYQRAQESRELFKKAKVELVVLQKVVEEYGK